MELLIPRESRGDTVLIVFIVLLASPFLCYSWETQRNGRLIIRSVNCSTPPTSTYSEISFSIINLGRRRFYESANGGRNIKLGQKPKGRGLGFEMVI